MAERTPLQPSTLRRAIRYRNFDGVCTKAMDTLTGGPFLAGLALALGASTFQIGLIAAIPFLSKVAFIPAVWVVERFQQRRWVCVTGAALGRPLLLAIALGALWLPPRLALWGLMGGLAAFSLLATFSGLAWNAWMKDLLPDRIRGRVFSKRLWLMGVAGMLLSVLGALAVDALRTRPAGTLQPLAWLFAAGAAAGLLGVVFLALIPETPAPTRGRRPLRAALAEPFADRGFRRLIAFSGSWSFATNLALPFITVYMLGVLELPFLLVIAFSAASQAANLAFLNLWGRLADRFGNKAVLVLCAPVFTLSLLLWAFTLNDHRWITLSLIALIHVMNGIATAGIDVANDNLLFQLAPKTGATAHFAAAALFNSVAAGLAPIAGGALAALFESHTFSLRLGWDAAEATFFRLQHLDFVFLAAFLAGLLALGRLRRVREREHEPSPAAVVKSVRSEIQNISTIKGMRHLTQAASFFAALLLESGQVLGRPREDERPDRSP